MYSKNPTKLTQRYKHPCSSTLQRNAKVVRHRCAYTGISAKKTIEVVHRNAFPRNRDSAEHKIKGQSLSFLGVTRLIISSMNLSSTSCKGIERGMFFFYTSCYLGYILCGSDGNEIVDIIASSWSWKLC